MSIKDLYQASMKQKKLKQFKDQMYMTGGLNNQEDILTGEKDFNNTQQVSMNLNTLMNSLDESISLQKTPDYNAKNIEVIDFKESEYFILQNKLKEQEYLQQQIQNGIHQMNKESDKSRNTSVTFTPHQKYIKKSTEINYNKDLMQI